MCNTVCAGVLCRVFGTSMVEEYEEIADSQYPSERLEYLDEDFGKMPVTRFQHQLKMYSNLTNG